MQGGGHRLTAEESGQALKSTGARGHCQHIPGLQGLRQGWKAGLRPLPGTNRLLSSGWVACGCSLVLGLARWGRKKANLGSAFRTV